MVNAVNDNMRDERRQVLLEYEGWMDGQLLS